MNLSPWPDEGRWWQFFYRRAVWAAVDPMYNENDVHHELGEITKFRLAFASFPFLTVRTPLFKFYIGWKPIFPALDSAFYWRDRPEVRGFLAAGTQFVQLSIRTGRGWA